MTGVTMKAGIWIVGGLCAGFGVLFLIGAFGPTGFGLISDGQVLPAASTYKNFGYDASLDVSLTSEGMMGIPLVLVGLALMVFANANAWKDTNNEY